MALETATYIDALVTSNPDGADARSTADDHLRLIKAVLKRSFPMIGGAVSASAQAICYVNDLSASAQAQINALRDGSHTALNALLATTATNANNAAQLGGVVAANYARLDVLNEFLAGQRISTAVPYLALYASGQTTDNKYWIPAEVAGQVMYSYALTDGGTAGYAYLAVTRSATQVETIAFSAKTGMTFNGSDLTNPTQMNSVPGASYARLDAAQTFGKGAGSTVVQIPAAASISPNMADGNVHRCILNQATTIAAPTAPRSGQTLVLHLIQDAVGGRTAAWNSIYAFPGGVDPTLSTAANARDVFAFNYDDLSAKWCAAGLNVS